LERSVGVSHFYNHSGLNFLPVVQLRAQKKDGGVRLALGSHLSEDAWLRGSFRFEVVAFTDKIVQNCFGHILSKLYCNSHLGEHSFYR
jgi:hypothetical protein